MMEKGPGDVSGAFFFGPFRWGSETETDLACRASPDRGWATGDLSTELYGEVTFNGSSLGSRCRIARPRGGRAMPGGAQGAP